MVSSIGGSSNVFQTMNTQTSSNTEDAASLLEAMQKKLLNDFAKSYDKTGSKDCKDVDEKAKSIIAKADTDNSGAVSLKELASIDTSNDPEAAKVVHDLIGKFKLYDKDGNGELGLDELKEALKTQEKQFSQQDIAKMAKQCNYLNSIELAQEGSIDAIPSSSVEKQINTYKNDPLKANESLLNIAG